MITDIARLVDDAKSLIAIDGDLSIETALTLVLVRRDARSLIRLRDAFLEQARTIEQVIVEKTELEP